MTADWFQAWAALAQAILAALAVFAAAWLQDRSLRKRDEGQRVRQLETVAGVAKWCWVTFERTEKRATSDGMSPQAFLDVYRPAEFQVALRGLRNLPVASFGDVELTSFMAELEAKFERTANELADAHRRAKDDSSERAVAAAQIVGKHHVEIFNAVANVERTVAARVRRTSTI